MIIDSLKSTLTTFFQGKISSLFLFLLSLSIATTVVEYGVLKRENAFDFLGPIENPQNIFTYVYNATPLGEIYLYTKGSSDTYRPYSGFYIRNSNYIKSYTANSWKKNSHQRNQKISERVKAFYIAYRNDVEHNKEVNGLYWSPEETVPIDMNTCFFNSFLKRKIGRTLILTTGKPGEEDFTGYDILQAGTEPVFAHKWKNDFFFSKKTAAIEMGMVFILALGKLISNGMN